MAKLDNEGRLLIPLDLISMLDYELTGEVYLCADIDKRIMYLVPMDKVGKNDPIVAKRKIDTKRRMFIGKEVRDFFGEGDTYTIFLQDEKIKITR